jgi:hypothetical protein
MSARKIIVLAVLLSLFSGAASSVATIYAMRRAKMIPPEVACIDLRKLLEIKRTQFTEKIKALQGKNDPQALKNAGAEIDAYIKNLQAEIDRQGKGRLVLVRDAVVSGDIRDITPGIEERAR